MTRASVRAAQSSPTRLSIPTASLSSRAVSPKSQLRRARYGHYVKITLGLSLALSGEYAPMGRQADAALQLFVADTNASGGVRLGDEHVEVALECIDDQSDPARCAEIYRALMRRSRRPIIFGPYSTISRARRSSNRGAAGRPFLNHGGAGD